MMVRTFLVLGEGSFYVAKTIFAKHILMLETAVFMKVMALPPAGKEHPIPEECPTAFATFRPRKGHCLVSEILSRVLVQTLLPIHATRPPADYLDGSQQDESDNRFPGS